MTDGWWFIIVVLVSGLVWVLGQESRRADREAHRADNAEFERDLLGTEQALEHAVRRAEQAERELAVIREQSNARGRHLVLTLDRQDAKVVEFRRALTRDGA